MQAYEPGFELKARHAPPRPTPPHLGEHDAAVSSCCSLSSARMRGVLTPRLLMLFTSRLCDVHRLLRIAFSASLR